MKRYLLNIAYFKKSALFVVNEVIIKMYSIYGG